MPCSTAKAAAPADSRPALFPRRPAIAPSPQQLCACALPRCGLCATAPPQIPGQSSPCRQQRVRTPISRVLPPPLLAESAARRPMSAAQDAAAATGAAGNDDELDDDEFTDSVSSDSISLC